MYLQFTNFGYIKLHVATQNHLVSVAKIRIIESCVDILQNMSLRHNCCIIKRKPNDCDSSSYAHVKWKSYG